MPQYEVGHLDRVRAIRDRLPGGIFVTGSAYAGVGIPDCVRDADETAEAVLRHRLGPPDGRRRRFDERRPTTIYALYPVFRATAALRRS